MIRRQLLSLSRVVAASIVVAALGATGCARVADTKSEETPGAEPEVEDALDHPMVSLSSVEEGSDEVVVEVRFTRSKELAGPRMLELWLEHENLSFVRAEPGEALTEAEKQLVVQKKAGARLRAIAFASQNLTPLESGVVMRLHFERKGTSEALVSLLDEQSMMAPRAASAGLTFGPPIRL